MNELKNGWQKATPAERDEFLRWLGIAFAPAPAAAISGSISNTSSPLLTADGFSQESTKVEVNTILFRHSIKAGRAMKDMGFNAMNPSLGLALHRGTRVKPDVEKALEKWISENSESR